MATALSIDDVLTEIYAREVRVRVIDGEEKLVVERGDTLSLGVKQAIRAHRTELIEYYKNPDLLQGKLDEIKAEIDALQKRIEAYGMDEGGYKASTELLDKLSDWWDRYYKILESRKANMRHPWARVTDDHRRCPKCPNLGLETNPVCAHKCPQM